MWVAGLLALVATTAQAAPVTFDIPAQPASSALVTFSKLTGAEVLFAADKVEGIRANAVTGALEPGEALARLLAETGLVASQRAPGKWVIAPAAKPASPPAANPPVKTATADERIVMSPFAATARREEDRYQPTDSISGGRARVNIFDSSQNISVIGSELIGDVGAGRVLDAVKYVPGITESTIPNGLDRITIRGFQTDSRTFDGITSSAQSNFDPFLVDRIEVVKGPNAILSPAGIPGGTINYVSKKPVFRDRGSLSVEAGRYDSQRVEFDVNRVLGSSQNVAIRLLGVWQDSDDYWGLPKKARSIAPMISVRLSPTTQLTWQTHVNDWEIQNYNGISVDPTVGTTSRARLYPGVPRDLNIYGKDSYRNDGRVENSLLFTTQLSERLFLRVQARHTNVYKFDFAATNLAGGASAAGTNANSFEPLTGNYTPGTVYATTPPYAASPVVISRTFNRSGQRADQGQVRYDQQADLYHAWENSWVRIESVVGEAYGRNQTYNRRNALTAPSVTLENFVYAPDVVGAVSTNQETANRSTQFYANEKVSFFGNRVIANAGYSWNRFDLETNDYRTSIVTTAEPTANLRNYGLVLKPVPSVAIFYNYSENAAPLGSATIAAGGPSTQTGKQDEVGARAHFMEQRLRLTVSYFDVQQNNFSVANPGNFAFPPPVPTLPGLLSNRESNGFEVELQGSLTKNLSVAGGYTAYKNRNPFGQEFRGNAERAWSALLNYTFPAASPLAGLSGGLGLDYLARRPGDDASGFTPAGVARKPTFYLPARTLTAVHAAYRMNRSWTLQLNVENLLNEDYLAASLGRGIVWPGTPLNLKVRVTYGF